MAEKLVYSLWQAVFGTQRANIAEHGERKLFWNVYAISPKYTAGTR